MIASFGGRRLKWEEGGGGGGGGWRGGGEGGEEERVQSRSFCLVLFCVSMCFHGICKVCTQQSIY